MAVDHMLFNKQNWFNVADNDDSVKANNKDYVALPTSFTLPKGTHVNDGSHQVGMNISQDCEVTCVGSSNDFYYFCGKIFTDWNGLNSELDIDNPKDVENKILYRAPWFIRKSKVTNVKWGGGKALLSHVYQWFRDTFRMVVIAC